MLVQPILSSEGALGKRGLFRKKRRCLGLGIYNRPQILGLEQGILIGSLRALFSVSAVCLHLKLERGCTGLRGSPVESLEKS